MARPHIPEVKPWYYGPPVESALPPEKERKQAKLKAERDPLTAMTVFLRKKKEVDAV